jgi:hypothetical protein
MRRLNFRSLRIPLFACATMLLCVVVVCFVSALKSKRGSILVWYQVYSTRGEESDGRGVKVDLWVDGQLRIHEMSAGPGHGQFIDVEPGTHTLRFVAPRYHPYEEKINVAPFSEAYIGADLWPLSGRGPARKRGAP